MANFMFMVFAADVQSYNIPTVHMIQIHPKGLKFSLPSKPTDLMHYFSETVTATFNRPR